ncbi:hypothetical protein C7446_2305 [Kushneria sinocarnis]|uniref:Uncharacterized protein n=1 Tax=Kushneria sinocarnis TaxID=595502 RepID=A0A420WVK8_9GAMM|nr:hypothetical protein [Kushneria sinocarnis]RKR02587.1 hypothetical protein C7446_2305 [Kushneria sinocarnis]
MSPDVWVSVVATLVAIVSAIFSIRSSRLSMRPVLSVWRDKKAESYQYYLSNKGNGPAIIDEVKVFIDNKEVVAPPEILFNESLKKLFRDNKKILPKINGSSFFGKGHPFGKDESKLIIDFTQIIDNDTSEIIDGTISLEKMLKQIKLTVFYRDMFDEKWHTVFDKHGRKVSRSWGDV